MSLQLETPKMVTQSGDTWSQLCLERSHTNMDTSAPAVFGCYQGTPPQTSPWLWLQLCLCPQHGHPQERRRESAGPSLKILSSQLLQDSDDCQWKQSFPGPPDYLSPWGPPHYSCSSPFISCTPRRAPGGLLPPAIPATIHNPTVVVQAGSAHHLNSGKSLPQDETSSAEGSRDIIISFSPSLSYPSELSKVMAQLSCSPFFLLLHPLLHTLGLSAGTMQSSHCCLLSLLLCLLSGTWANLEGAFTLRLLQTTTFQNTSFTDTEGLGLLEDIELGSLDKHTWSIHFCQPWVRPALPHVDWDTIENLLKVYLQKFNHLINEEAMQRDVPYPFVVQCMAGCMLYPNRTSQAFAYVGYNGQDFLSFDTENVTWTLSQDTKLSRELRSGADHRAHGRTACCHGHCCHISALGVETKKAPADGGIRVQELHPEQRSLAQKGGNSPHSLPLPSKQQELPFSASPKFWALPIARLIQFRDAQEKPGKRNLSF
ncbi:uncharacterized protein M8220_008286 isoform 2-T2 [Acridotheres tristis]